MKKINVFEKATNDFYAFYDDKNSANKYVSDDGTESWFDYKISNINYHCIRYTYNNGYFSISVWFDNENYKNGWHVCRFQTQGKDFIKIFNKIKKLCSEKEIDFNGTTSFYENTSGNYWKKIDF